MIALDDIADRHLPPPPGRVGEGLILSPIVPPLWEAATRRRMMSISTHDRISGTPARVRALGAFIDYAQQHAGVHFMRKDDIARWALNQTDTPQEDAP